MIKNTFLIKSIFLSLLMLQSLFALTETSANPNKSGSAYTISGLDGISSDQTSTTNYYSSSYNNIQNIYFEFTPSVSGEVTLSEGEHPWGNEMKVKFYVGTSANGTDIIYSKSNSYTHGPFTFSVMANQTYYVKIRKKNIDYMRFSLTYAFTATAGGSDDTCDGSLITDLDGTKSGSFNGSVQNSSDQNDYFYFTSSVDGVLDLNLSSTHLHPNHSTDYYVRIGNTSCGSSNLYYNNNGSNYHSKSNISVTAGDKIYVRVYRTNDSGNRPYNLAYTFQALSMEASAQDNSVTEGDSGTVTVNVSVTLTRAVSPGEAFSVDYATSDNTATAGVDYVATSGTLTFNSGERTKSVSVTVNSDTDVESDELFYFTLSNPTTGFTISDAIADITITNDDTIPTPPDETLPTTNANETTVICDVFEDALQTRATNSTITHLSGASATVYNNPDTSLNTGSVDFGEWQELTCETTDDTEACAASGNTGESISVNYSFTVPSLSLTDTPSSSSTDYTFSADETIDGSAVYEYNTMTIGWSSYGLDITYDITNTFNINTLSMTKNNTFSFTGAGLYALNIGSLESISGADDNTFSTDSNAKNIKIDTLDLTGTNTVNFAATQTIQIENFSIGRDDSMVTLKAPYVHMGAFKTTTSGSGSVNIEIVADYVDISSITLEEAATLTFKPYTAGKRVLVKAGTISEASSTSIVLSSGNYYTNELLIPGTSNSRALIAIDSDALINFYINGDFAPGNNPGINSDNNGAFGSLSPAQFFLFVNGDITTGGGGTTFNATVYVEGNAYLGSPTYIKGALSANEIIEIGNSSEIYYDQSIENMNNNACAVTGPSYGNYYSCGIFPSVLTSYEHINVEDSQNGKACFTDTLSYPGGGTTDPNDDEITGTFECTANSCNTATSECQGENPPTNKYTHNFPTNSKSGTTESSTPTYLNDLEYGNISYTANNINVEFNASVPYSDNPTNLMMLGDVSFSGNGAELQFRPGDYYFDSLTFEKNGANIVILDGGPVRIFIKNDFVVNFNGTNLNENGDSEDLFIYIGGDLNFTGSGGGTNTIDAFLYVKGDTTLSNSSNNFVVTGGITTEGRITIDGNNPDFVYDEEGAENIGFGECAICYSAPQQGGMSMGPMSFMTTVTVPIKNISDETYPSVTITEIHDSGFNFSMMSNHQVQDQDGTKLSDAEQNSTGISMGFDDLISVGDYNSLTYTYNMENYPPSTAEAYNQLYSSTLFSFTLSDWDSTLDYIAEYQDSQGRNYKVLMGQCEEINYDCSNPRAYTLRYSINQKGNMVIIGNSAMCKRSGSGCVAPNDNEVNNDIHMNFMDGDANSSTTSSSAARLELPEDSEVLFAGIYWQGRIRSNDEATKEGAGSVSFGFSTVDDKTSVTYTPITADDYNWRIKARSNGTFSAFDYLGFKDVTNEVNTTGNGWYWVSGITVSTTTSNVYGGWALVVVYKNVNEHLKNLSVFDGYFALTGNNSSDQTYANNNGCEEIGSDSSASVSLSGFLTPVRGDVNSTFYIFAGEGDKYKPGSSWTIGDRVSLSDEEGTDIYLEDPTSSAPNKSDELFNSSISVDGEFVTSDYLYPWYSTNSVGIDIDTFDVSHIIGNSQTSTTIKLSTSHDEYYPSIFGFATDLYEPRVCYVETYYHMNGDGSKGSEIDLSQEVLQAGTKVIVETNISNRLPSDSSDDFVEIAKNVEIQFLRDPEVFTYEENTTYGQNIDSSYSLFMTDDYYDDIVEYNAETKVSTYRVGPEANATAGGTVDYLDMAMFTYTNNVVATQTDSNVTLKNTYVVSYRNDQLDQDFNSVPMNECDEVVTYLNTGVSGNIRIFPASMLGKTWIEIWNTAYIPTTISPMGERYCMLVGTSGDSSATPYGSDIDINVSLAESSVIDDWYVEAERNNSTLALEYLNQDIEQGNIAFKSSLTAPGYSGGQLSAVSSSKVVCFDVNLSSYVNKKMQFFAFNRDLPIHSDNDSMSDFFAIRPDKFTMSPELQAHYAANFDVNISFKALDSDGVTPSNEYNEYIKTSFDVNATDVLDLCQGDSELTYQGTQGSNFFSNGSYRGLFSYSNVGEDIAVTIAEINGSEYAVVDKNDTSDDERLITPAEINVSVMPYQVVIDSATLTTPNGLNGFAYSSANGDLTNMYIRNDFTVVAQDADDKNLTDFNASCYSEEVNVTFGYETLNANGATEFCFKNTNDDSNGTLSDLNKTVSVPASFFENGAADYNYSFNVLKALNAPHKPIGITLKDSNTTSQNTAVYTTKTHSENVSVYFARLVIKDKKTYTDTASLDISYQIYDPDNIITGLTQTDQFDSEWKISSNHNTGTDGSFALSAGTSYDTSVISSHTISSMNQGEQNVTITRLSNVTLPVKTKIRFIISDWLWTSSSDTMYNAPGNTGSSCATYPCVDITFMENSDGWSGVGRENTQNRNGDDSTTSIDAKTKEVEQRTVTVERNETLGIDKEEFIKSTW